MVAWIRVGMVVGSSCFGLSLLPLFLAGTFFGLLCFIHKRNHGKQVTGSQITCAQLSAMDATRTARTMLFQEPAK
jgi:hypothetical protein